MPHCRHHHRRWFWFIVIPVCGYGFAWFGHFFFEKNKPATFTYPLYSLGSDFVMFWHIITGQIGKKMEEAKVINNDLDARCWILDTVIEFQISVSSIKYLVSNIPFRYLMFHYPLVTTDR
jgi:hypothetical protein